MKLISSSGSVVKISAKPRNGPTTTLTSQKKAATRSVYHQRPRTSSELPLNASRSPRSSNRICCWTKSQPTYFQAANGMPMIVSDHQRCIATVASSWAPTTRLKRSQTPL